MNKPGNEKGCNFAPVIALHCIKWGVFMVSISDRITANKL